MELELFKKTYTPTMLKLIEQFSNKLELEIKQDLSSDSHHVVLKAKDKLSDLAQCKMIISAYEGCPICFYPECTSDHS